MYGKSIRKNNFVAARVKIFSSPVFIETRVFFYLNLAIRIILNNNQNRVGIFFSRKYNNQAIYTYTHSLIKRINSQIRIYSFTDVRTFIISDISCKYTHVTCRIIAGKYI